MVVNIILEFCFMWNWKFFKPSEIACRGKTCGCNGELWNNGEYGEVMPYYLIDALDKLEMLRKRWGKPIVLNSAHRCEKHNKAVGGASRSQHLKIAFDCRISADEQDRFIELARECGFTGIGRYTNFVHLDLGRKREWTGK